VEATGQQTSQPYSIFATLLTVRVEGAIVVLAGKSPTRNPEPKDPRAYITGTEDPMYGCQIGKNSCRACSHSRLLDEIVFSGPQIWLILRDLWSKSLKLSETG
jgi:hypothetical protein